MKIIETKQYVFDEEDRRLLFIEIPDNPCEKCCLKNDGCCGCSENLKYQEIIKPYKDRNIYDLALKFKYIHQLQIEILEKQNKIDEITKEIEKTGLFN